MAADDGIGMGEQATDDGQCRQTSQPQCYHPGDVFTNQMCPIIVDLLVRAREKYFNFPDVKVQSEQFSSLTSHSNMLLQISSYYFPDVIYNGLWSKTTLPNSL